MFLGLTLENLSIFSVAALVLLLTPGPAVLYIVARSISQGRGAGLASVFGVQLGNFVHVIVAVMGLSAVLMTSALAFNVVKYLGAAYLIYLGVKTILSPNTIVPDDDTPPTPIKRIFSQGIMVAVLNPKTALFFLAFLPQFVDAKNGDVSTQIFILGMIFVMMGMITDGSYAMLSGTLGGWLKRSQRFLRFQPYFSGSIFIGLGITAALAGHSRK